MAGFLSLPDEVIELIGEQVLRNSHFKLKDWCQVTRTCKRLWGMQLPGSESESGVDLDEEHEDIRGVPWAMERVKATRELFITKASSKPVPLMRMRLALKAMTAASRSFPNLTQLDLDICKEETCRYPIQTGTIGAFYQSWMSALLLGATKLTSLRVVTDAVPLPPVLGQLPLRHLELTMQRERPWLGGLMADLSFCSCLETLQIENSALGCDVPSKNLPSVSLHGVATLKSVTVRGWYPKGKFTLPRGCLLGLAVVLKTQAQWKQWQRKGCATTLLYLVCMKLQAWPAGVADVSGLQYLELHSTKMHDQDLAALQRIPRVFVYVKEFSSFLLTTGTWQRLEIAGRFGFSMKISNADAFVRGTQQFQFVNISHLADKMYGDLRAACRRQGVACHECEHPPRRPGDLDSITIVRLSNVKVCRAPERNFIGHDDLTPIWKGRLWASYPELYS